MPLIMPILITNRVSRPCSYFMLTIAIRFYFNAWICAADFRNGRWIRRVDFRAPRIFHGKSCILNTVPNLNSSTGTHSSPNSKSNDILLHENEHQTKYLILNSIRVKGRFIVFGSQNAYLHRNTVRASKKDEDTRKAATTDKVDWTVHSASANRNMNNKTTSSIANGYFIWILATDCLCTTDRFYSTFVLVIWLPLYYYHHESNAFCWLALFALACSLIKLYSHTNSSEWHQIWIIKVWIH